MHLATGVTATWTALATLSLSPRPACYLSFFNMIMQDKFVHADGEFQVTC